MYKIEKFEGIVIGNFFREKNNIVKVRTGGTNKDILIKKVIFQQWNKVPGSHEQKIDVVIKGIDITNLMNKGEK